MKKVAKDTIHFQHVDKDTGEKLGNAYSRVQNIYRRGVTRVVRQNGRFHETWVCPTDNVWKCYIPVRILPNEAVLTFGQMIESICP
jgi:hypothetical protein